MTRIDCVVLPCKPFHEDAFFVLLHKQPLDQKSFNLSRRLENRPLNAHNTSVAICHTRGGS